MRNLGFQAKLSGFHFASFYPCIGLLLLLVALAGGQISAQAPSATSTVVHGDKNSAQGKHGAGLSVELDGQGSAEITLDFDSDLESKYNFPVALSTAFGCPLKGLELTRDNEQNIATLTASCDLKLRRSRAAKIGIIDLRPLKAIQHEEPNLDFVLRVTVPLHDFVSCDPAPDEFHQGPGSGNCLYFLQSAGSIPDTIYFQSGYSHAHILRIVLSLGFLLLLPIAATFWFRRRSQQANEEAKPSVWFAYRRFLTWTALFGALIWWATVDLLQADGFVRFLLPESNWSDALASVAIAWVLLWLPPACVYVVCLALSAPMQLMRGTNYTQKQILNRSFWAVARFAFPLPLVALGVMELFSTPRVGVLFITAGIVAGRFATKRFVRAYGLELHALTSGELRDRAFALAEKAGIKLNQLFVLPTETIRMANAFAHAARNIYLTDYLLKNLDKAEVDAVVGHEIAHLQKKHVGWRMAAAFLLISAYVFSSVFLEHWLPGTFPSGPIFYSLALLAVFFISRRNEFRADAGSAKLTGNAEAMITALARITRLNTMPLHWGKFDEKMLTHPSTLRRIKRLASETGIPEARIPELLSESLAPPADTYAIPRTALPAGKIFSTRYKAQLAGKFAWWIMLTTVMLPACVALAANWGQLGGGKLLLAYLVGLFATLAADLALLNFLPILGLAKMERALRQKFQSEAATDGSNLFVSLAPDPCPRVYEGNWAWDLGFVTLSGEYLAYQGEEARFSIRREEISSIYLGPGPSSWFDIPAVYISWRDSVGRESVLNLRALRAKSMREMALKTRHLARDLQNWHTLLSPTSNPVPVAEESATENASVPGFGQVTSVSPRALLRGQYLVRDFFLNTLLAVGAILLFGLGFPLVDDLFSSSDLANPSPSYGGLYVLLVVWLARVLVLLPFRRTRENKLSGEPPQAVSASSR